MIKIAFNPKEMELTVKGHANFDEKGKDIVCASVSILFYTLAFSLKKAQKMLVKDSLKAEVGEGYSLVACKPKGKYTANVESIYWVCLNGLELLADDYPDYVQIEIISDGLENADSTKVG